MDQKEKGYISIRFCPTDLMIGNYMMKPLHGQKFTQFQQEIMNLLIAAQLIMWHCVHLLSWSDCAYMKHFYTHQKTCQYLPSWQTGVCWNIFEHLLKGQTVQQVYKVTKDTFRKDKYEVIMCVSQRTIMSI